MCDNFQTLVIDNGSSCIKVGFSGEKLPQFTFPTIIGYPKYNDSSYKICIGKETIKKEGILIIKYPIDQGIITNFDDMTKIWHYAFSNVVHTDISNHPVLLTEAPKTPPKYREKMTEIMFETFIVPSFYVQKQPVLSLYSSRRTSGVVLESGYSASHTVPVYEGYMIPHASISNGFAGRSLEIYLYNILKKLGYDFCHTSDLHIIEKIKNQFCYVALNYNTEKIISESSSDNEVTYTSSYYGKCTLYFERFKCPEFLFEPKIDGLAEDGIGKNLFNSISMCDEDIQNQLYSNIVIAGGTTLFKGFKKRVELEIEKYAEPDISINVIAPPERQYAAWIGGSVLASNPIFEQMIIKRNEYKEAGTKIVNYKCL